MIVLTCKTCNQSFKVENLKDDVSTVACPKCFSSIDIQSSKTIIDERQRRRARRNQSAHFVLNFVVCLFWSILVYFAAAYMYYETTRAAQFKTVDELVNCAIQSIQSVALDRKPIVHISDVPIKVVENAEKALENTEQDDDLNPTVDEPTESTDWTKIVAEKTFQFLVDSTSIEYVALLDYKDKKSKVYASKSNGDFSNRAIVSLANSTFTTVDKFRYHKKYEVSNSDSQYVYVHFQLEVEYMHYVCMFLAFVILTLVLYMSVYFTTLKMHAVAKSNVQL